MPDWLAPIITFFAKLFSPSRPADSSHNQSAQTGDVGTLIQAQEGSQVNVNTPQQQPAEPAFSEIEKDILRAVELNTIFTVFRHPKESQVLIKVRVAGKKTAMFHFPDDPIKNLAYVEALQSLCDRGFFSQQADSPSFTDTYRPTVTGHETAKKLQADSTS